MNFSPAHYYFNTKSPGLFNFSRVTFLVFVFFLTFFVLPSTIYADNSCTGTVDSHTLDKTDETKGFNFSLTNTGDYAFVVAISFDKTYVFIDSAGDDGGMTSDSQGNFSGDFNPGQTINFSVSAGEVAPTTGNWSVIIGNSTGIVNCSGDFSLTVTDSTLPAPTATPTPTPITITVTNTVTETKTVTVTASPTPSPKPTPTPKPIVDTTPPHIEITTDFAKAFKEPPKILGTAVDLGGISKIEYSMDEGKNWLPVEKTKDPGTKSTDFEFTPKIFQDDNYLIKVRAKDLTGNIGTSPDYTMIIDRLPPQVGGTLFSIGPEIQKPDKNGVLLALAGVEEKITLSAVGGPTGIDLYENGIVYPMLKNIDSGLWDGKIKFSQMGIYQLKAKAVDGAQNTTERQLDTLVVLNNGVVKDQRGEAIKGAKVTLYYFEPTSNTFVVWDGKSFGQENPQTTDENGQYRLMVPPGKYYIEVSFPGYKTLNTNIFVLNENMPINVNFTLNNTTHFRLGSFTFHLPSFKAETVEMNLAYPVMPKIENKKNILGKDLPFAVLLNEDKQFPLNTLRGKPTILSFMSTWLPETADQLNILDNLSKQNPDINIDVVMSQEQQSKISIFKKTGNYSVPILVDPDGTLVSQFETSYLPAHYFVNRRGQVKKIRVGVLKEKELMDNLIEQ